MSGSYSSEQNLYRQQNNSMGLASIGRYITVTPFFHNLWATSETASGILTNRPLAILLGCITVKQLTWDGTGHSTQANFLIAEYLSSRLVGITTHTSCVCRQARKAHLKPQFFIPAFVLYFPPTPF